MYIWDSIHRFRVHWTLHSRNWPGKRVNSHCVFSYKWWWCYFTKRNKARRQRKSSFLGRKAFELLRPIPTFLMWNEGVALTSSAFRDARWWLIGRHLHMARRGYLFTS